VTAPLPPDDLASRAPLMVSLPVRTVLHRFHAAERTPIFFDTSDLGRLNAPERSYGVLYAARRVRGAFAETFLRKPGRVLLPADLISAKAYARLAVTQTVRLIRFHGPWPGPPGRHGGNHPCRPALRYAASVVRRPARPPDQGRRGGLSRAP
jgi:hypothetical protein